MKISYFSNKNFFTNSNLEDFPKLNSKLKIFTNYL